MKVYKFNKDEACDKFISYKRPEEIFTDNIYAHKHCMKRYMKEILDGTKELL